MGGIGGDGGDVEKRQMTTNAIVKGFNSEGRQRWRERERRPLFPQRVGVKPKTALPKRGGKLGSGGKKRQASVHITEVAGTRERHRNKPRGLGRVKVRKEGSGKEIRLLGKLKNRQVPGGEKR